MVWGRAVERQRRGSLKRLQGTDRLLSVPPKKPSTLVHTRTCNTMYEISIRGILCRRVGLEVERECYGRVLGSADRLEGLAAFSERRAPIYRGK